MLLERLWLDRVACIVKSLKKVEVFEYFEDLMDVYWKMFLVRFCFLFVRMVIVMVVRIRIVVAVSEYIIHVCSVCIWVVVVGW